MNLIQQKFLCTWVSVLILLSSAEARDTSEKTDSLYQHATVGLGAASPDESIKAFQAVVRSDWDHAPAHYDLAKLYLERGTLQSRLRAEKSIKEAMRVDSDHVDYQLTWGDILWAQGFTGNADAHYQKMIVRFPGHGQPSYRVGYYALMNFWKYLNMESVDRISGVAEGDQTTRLVSWGKFAEQERTKALLHLKNSLRVDPEFRDPYYQLGLLYFESAQPESLIHISTALLQRVAGDKDALLFCGLGNHRLGRFETANQFFSDALERMTAEERSIVESVDLLGGKDEIKPVRTVAADVRESGRNQHDVFWKPQDPLYLTDYNERRMEHYARMAYANLRFSRPSRKIAGWQTDMGKAYIRFGDYLGRKVARPEYRFSTPLDGPMELSPGDAPRPIEPFEELANIEHQKETWFYDGFQVEFVVPDGFHGRFATGTPNQPHYVDPYATQKYSIPTQVVAFKEGEGVRMELTYMLPRDRLGSPAVILENGIFVFDADWNEVHKQPFKFNFKWPSSQEAATSKADSLRKSHVMFSGNVLVDSGAYHVVVESLDRSLGSIGSFRTRSTYGFPDSVLAMSDLLLATSIEERTLRPERRSDLSIRSNPIRTFGQSEAVFVYVEMYHLTRNEFGRTRYEIRYEISQAEEESIDPTMFAAFDLSGPGAASVETSIRETPVTLTEHENAILPQVTYQIQYALPERNRVQEERDALVAEGDDVQTAVTAQYEGNSADDFTYLSIDIGSVPQGVHRLTATLRDMLAGQTVEKQTLFRIVE